MTGQSDGYKQSGTITLFSTGRLRGGNTNADSRSFSIS
jgi:hypothetical protein